MLLHVQAWQSDPHLQIQHCTDDNPIHTYKSNTALMTIRSTPTNPTLHWWQSDPHLQIQHCTDGTLSFNKTRGSVVIPRWAYPLIKQGAPSWSLAGPYTIALIGAIDQILLNRSKPKKSRSDRSDREATATPLSLLFAMFIIWLCGSESWADVHDRAWLGDGPDFVKIMEKSWKARLESEKLHADSCTNNQDEPARSGPPRTGQDRTTRRVNSNCWFETHAFMERTDRHMLNNVARSPTGLPPRLGQLRFFCDQKSSMDHVYARVEQCHQGPLVYSYDLHFRTLSGASSCTQCPHCGRTFIWNFPE